MSQHFAHTLHLFNAILIINSNYFPKQENQVDVYKRLQVLSVKYEQDFKYYLD